MTNPIHIGRSSGPSGVELAPSRTIDAMTATIEVRLHTDSASFVLPLRAVDEAKQLRWLTVKLRRLSTAGLTLAV